MTASNVSLTKLLVALALCLPISFTTGASAAAVPELVSPKTGATLPNGSLNKNVEYTWVFEWKAVPAATDYHLVVIRDGAKLTLVDTRSQNSNIASFREATSQRKTREAGSGRFAPK